MNKHSVHKSIDDFGFVVYTYRGVTFEKSDTIPHGYYGHYRTTSGTRLSSGNRKTLLIQIDSVIDSKKS